MAISEEQQRALAVLRQQANLHGIVCMEEQDREMLFTLEQRRAGIIRTETGLKAE